MGKCRKCGLCLLPYRFWHQGKPDSLESSTSWLGESISSSSRSFKMPGTKRHDCEIAVVTSLPLSRFLPLHTFRVPRMPSEVGGASRVDDVVLGKDIDGATRMSEHSVYVRFSWAGSAQQFARLAEGAAGTGWHEARTFSPAHSRIVCVTITRCSAGAAGRRCVGALIHGCCSHAISLLGS